MTTEAAPETLAAAVEKLTKFALSARVVDDAIEAPALIECASGGMLRRDQVEALAAQHDAEMARLRQERDAAILAFEANNEAVDVYQRELAAALTRAQAEAKLTDDALYEIWSEFNAERDWMRQRLLDTLFGHGDPTA